MKFSLIVSLLLFSTNTLALEPVVKKHPVNFSEFWDQSEQLKQKYECDFSKGKNPYFEFLYTVLNIENSSLEDVKNTSIFTNRSSEIIKEKLLSKTKEDNSYAEVLCVTNEKALVLRRHQSVVHPSGFGLGVFWISQYDFKTLNNNIKLEVHENSYEELWYRMNKIIESHIYYKVQYSQAIPTGE